MEEKICIGCIEFDFEIVANAEEWMELMKLGELM